MYQRKIQQVYFYSKLWKIIIVTVYTIAQFHILRIVIYLTLLLFISHLFDM